MCPGGFNPRVSIENWQKRESELPIFKHWYACFPVDKIIYWLDSFGQWAGLIYWMGNFGQRIRTTLIYWVGNSIYCSGVSRMAYPRGANRGRGFGAPGKLKNGAPRRRCWMREGGSMLEVIISFSDNVIGIRLLKIALTLNWLVLNVRASSTRKLEMLSEKWRAHYSVNFMNNFGLLMWVPINRYYWVILGIIVKNVFKKNI